VKAIKRRELVSELTTLGFVFDGEGRHPMFKCQFTGFRIPVPNGREVSPGTLRDILKLIKRAKELRALANSNTAKVK
jgi:predicted RNA binding protein YcfA (HicA-like mRNA interferase family)